MSRPWFNWSVWAALMLLLVLTVGLSYVELGAFSTPVAMAIAVAKTVLVVAFYMHFLESKPLIRLFSLAVLAWIVILFAMTFCDLFSRPL